MWTEKGEKGSDEDDATSRQRHERRKEIVKDAYCKYTYVLHILYCISTLNGTLEKKLGSLEYDSF
jgi:hypothetical protein